MSSELVQGTVAALGLAVLAQAIEDRAPTPEQADQWAAAVALAGAGTGLYLMHANSPTRGSATHEIGKALWYSGASWLGAEGTRYVDHRLASAAAASSAAKMASVRSVPTPAAPTPSGVGVKAQESLVEW